MQLGSACDSLHQSDCQIIADTEMNQTLVIPPIQSAMISTRNKVSINYGRVTIRARMPTGCVLLSLFRPRGLSVSRRLFSPAQRTCPILACR